MRSVCKRRSDSSTERRMVAGRESGIRACGPAAWGASNVSPNLVASTIRSRNGRKARPSSSSLSCGRSACRKPQLYRKRCNPSPPHRRAVPSFRACLPVRRRHGSCPCTPKPTEETLNPLNPNVLYFISLFIGRNLHLANVGAFLFFQRHIEETAPPCSVHASAPSPRRSARSRKSRYSP